MIALCIRPAETGSLSSEIHRHATPTPLNRDVRRITPTQPIRFTHLARRPIEQPKFAVGCAPLSLTRGTQEPKARDPILKLTNTTSLFANALLVHRGELPPSRSPQSNHRAARSLASRTHTHRHFEAHPTARRARESAPHAVRARRIGRARRTILTGRRRSSAAPTGGERTTLERHDAWPPHPPRRSSVAWSFTAMPGPEQQRGEHAPSNRAPQPLPPSNRFQAGTGPEFEASPPPIGQCQSGGLSPFGMACTIDWVPAPHRRQQAAEESMAHAMSIPDGEDASGKLQRVGDLRNRARPRACSLQRH